MEESIEGMAKALRLQNARRHYRELVDEALAAGLGYGQFLRLVFERECESRSAKAVEKKIRSARFPYIKTFDEMDWSAFSVPVARTIRELQSLSFAREGGTSFSSAIRKRGKRTRRSRLGCSPASGG